MASQPLELRALNHASFVVRDVAESADFYRNVLGFTVVKRPENFKFVGCWLWRAGFGIHLIKGVPRNNRSRPIEPKSDHLSFLADDLDMIESQLEAHQVEFVPQRTVEGDITVRQVFFHDPDGNMIEICNCDEFPLCRVATSYLAGLENGSSGDEPHTPPARWSFRQGSVDSSDGSYRSYMSGRTEDSSIL